jgi:hypothetical protein
VIGEYKTSSVLEISTPIILFLRRVTWTALTVLLYNHPRLLISIIVLMSIVYIFFLVKVRPIESKFVMVV